MATKNDIYAKLIKIGIDKGYEVIPEFFVSLPNKRKKYIDLVWCIKNNNEIGYQNQKNDDYWTVIAAFEIEGANVPIEKEFSRHVNDFQYLTNSKCNQDIKKFVVLYTNAYDRSWNNTKNYDDEIEKRNNWAKDFKADFSVRSGRDFSWAVNITPEK